MSSDRDPFELLPHFTDPEPDTVVMNATIARATKAFSSRQLPPQRAGKTPWMDWFQQPPRWLMPAGAGAFALVAAIAVAPAMLRSPDFTAADGEQLAEAPASPIPAPAQERHTLSRDAETVADTPPLSNEGVRMGMQPSPGPTPAEPAPAVASVFEGDGIRIGSRLSPSALDIYLPDISGEAIIDSQGLIPGEDIEILAAFQLPKQEIVAVRMRVDDTRFWRIYRPLDGQYARDPELSRLVLDAPDRAEVEQRLSAP